MSWLDYWPLPWLLYGAVPLRSLAMACLTAMALTYLFFRRARRG